MKISIIIPTRERALYLGAAIKSALAINDDNMEVIVSNNASSDATEEIVEAETDSRLIYIRTDKRVSMRQNFQFALNKATGDYILYIGDDDAVFPGQFAALRKILETHRPDSLSWPRLTYRWPTDFSTPKFGRLLLNQENFFGDVREVDAQKWHRELLSGSVVWDDSFPALYHGIVSRSCLDRLTPPGEDFFQCKIPDVYFSFLGVVDKIQSMHADHSFSLSGQSAASTGSSQRNQANNTSKESPAKKFEVEAAADTLQDPFQFGDGIPATLFETFAAVMAIRPACEDRADYPAWYRYVLEGSRDHSEESWRAMLGNLEEHARQKGVLEAYLQLRAKIEQDTEPAKSAGLQNQAHQKPNWLQRRLEKWQDKKRSFKLFGAKTAFGAVNLTDKALSQDYLDVLAGKKSRTKVWTNALRRSRSVSGMDLD